MKQDKECAILRDRRKRLLISGPVRMPRSVGIIPPVKKLKGPTARSQISLADPVVRTHIRLLAVKPNP